MEQKEQKSSVPPPPIKIPPGIGKTPAVRLLAGVGSGWVAGLITVRVGKVPVALIGTSIILFQAANDHGMIKHSWSDLNAKAKDVTAGSKSNLDKVKQFASENPAFTAGFTGGFLIGLTC